MIQSKTHSLQSLYCIVEARREQTSTCSWRFSFSRLYARRKIFVVDDAVSLLSSISHAARVSQSHC